MKWKWCCLCAILYVAIMAMACKGNNEPIDPAAGDMTIALIGKVQITNGWVFDKRPTINVKVTNPSEDITAKAVLIVHFQTDKKEKLFSIADSSSILAGKTHTFHITPAEDMASGVYRAICMLNGNVVKYFNFVVNPFDIVSAPDKQPDYDAFWTAAKLQLAAVDMQPVLTEIPTKSTAKCKVYVVSFYSIPDGLEGNPVLIHGYYLEPQDGQKHPVVMHYYGYDTQPVYPKISCPLANSGDKAEFHLSLRGQLINARAEALREPDGLGDFNNIYGDWFAWHFGDKNSYYYRGAFMDAVQAVRFMATRETSDMNNLFAEGSSQGGAMCYAAAALSDIPFSAIAANVAFLGDFPDYFKIVDWPASTAKANMGSMTDAEMYAFLSYFDTKNLATRISCAVYATSGLQDGICPTHTNLAPFNNLLSTDKEMHFYPEMQHAYPPSWYADIQSFFNARTQ